MAREKSADHSDEIDDMLRRYVCDYSEQSVLGSMLLDSAAVKTAVLMLDATDFYRTRHQILFNVMRDMVAEQLPIDLTTVYHFVCRADAREEVGGVGYVSGLEHNVLTTRNIATHCALVFENRIWRDLYGHLSLAQKQMIHSNPEAMIAGLEDRFKNIRAARMRAIAEELKDIAGDICEGMIAERDGDGVLIIPTGMVDVDELIGGLRPGEYYVIGARPSIGKSALAGWMMRTAAQGGHRSFLVSLEMRKREWQTRWMAGLADIGMKTIRDRRFDDRQAEYLRAATAEIKTWPIAIDDRPALDIAEIEVAVRRYKNTTPDCKIAFIDHMQLASDRRYSIKRHEVSAISKRLCAMAKELEIAVVCLSQLRRPNPGEFLTIPKLEDLKESGDIEQDADTVLLLHRNHDKEAELPDEDPRRMMIRVAKQRNGPRGDVEVLFHGATQRFSPLLRAAWDRDYWGLKPRRRKVRAAGGE